MPDLAVHSTSMPAPYRLLLATSLAILTHTLVLAGLPAPLTEAQELTHRLVFTLTSPVAPPTQEKAPAPSQNAPEHAEPDTGRPPDATPRAPSRTMAEPQPERTPRTDTQNNRGTSSPKPMPESQASRSTPALTPRVSEPTQTPERIKRITESPSENDPYLIRLATHLAENLDQKRVPEISALTETVSMELELRLMPNGALTRARVIRSTGVEGIDRAAYRTALAASPYPSPEGEESDRFEVELVFTPKRQ
ncbi:TonB family protein [Marinobacter sp. VGCF2001]|uniref:energy transducer TonB family protein n=1 Tax=Marinobacter sp. VGCF2001 TaxID=3417189 RepID=UPI003CF7D832